jgi:hypothetical protein
MLKKLRFELVELASGRYVVTFQERLGFFSGYDTPRYPVKSQYSSCGFDAYHIHDNCVYDVSHGETTMLKALDAIVMYIRNSGKEEPIPELSDKYIVESRVKFDTLDELMIFRNGLEKVQINVHGFDENA